MASALGFKTLSSEGMQLNVVARCEYMGCMVTYADTMWVIAVLTQGCWLAKGCEPSLLRSFL